MYRFMLWLTPTVDSFPRRQKFLLGDHIQKTALDILSTLIEATYTKQRSNLLIRANLGIQKLRIFFRLAHELKLVDHRRYEHSARVMDEIGRLIGGWRKAHHAAQA